jgi:hypothetical protein
MFDAILIGGMAGSALIRNRGQCIVANTNGRRTDRSRCRLHFSLFSLARWMLRVTGSTDEKRMPTSRKLLNTLLLFLLIVIRNLFMATRT